MAKVSHQQKGTVEAYDPGLTPVADLETLRASLQKQLGGNIHFGRDTALQVRYMQTGMPALDSFLGGGFAFGRLVLLYGQFSAGKSVIAALGARAAQAQGLSVAWIDAEKAWNPEWAEALGVNPAQMIVTQPTTGEEAFEQAFALLKAKVGLIVFDSLMAMRTHTEFDNEPGENMERSNMGAHAKMIGKGLLDCMALNQGTALVAINQIREKVGVFYGSPETIPGGRGQHFVASQEVKVSRGEWLTEDPNKKSSRRMGYRMRLTMEKNKLGRPYTTVELPFYFTGQFDEIAGLIDMAIEVGAIVSKPPMYHIGAEKFFGRGKLQEAVHDRPELLAELTRLINEVPEVEL